MKTLKTVADLALLKKGVVEEKARDIIRILNEAYPGREQNIHADGGHVVVFETEAEFDEWCSQDAVPEVVSAHKGYCEIMVLSNNEYSITYLVPESVVPQGRVRSAFPLEFEDLSSGGKGV